MNRIEILRLLLKQAQVNGFEFRRWFTARIQPAWPGAEQALILLAEEGRYYRLLFSHEFARSFWLKGSHMSFTVPAITYPRVNRQGKVVQITRKPFTRRTVKRDVWKYHLGKMAAAENPIDYLGRFLPAHQQIAMQKASGTAMAIQA